MNTKLRNYILIRLGILILLLYTFAFIAYKANADDYVSVGLGVLNSALPHPVDVKFIQVGHRDTLGFGFINQYEAGGWLQTDLGDGRHSSGYIADQLGLEVNNGLTIRIATGPSLITTKDSYLGGIFQFTEDLFIGLKDNNASIGFKYKHFSSAGLEMPNNGRDFGCLEVSFPW